jgi:hypothetical protein
MVNITNPYHFFTIFGGLTIKSTLMKLIQLTLLHRVIWLIYELFIPQNVSLKITKINEVRIYY